MTAAPHPACTPVHEVKFTALDLKAVRTMLTPLQRQRQIVRRTVERNVPETYEYACPSVSQSPGHTSTAPFLASPCVD